MPKYNLMGTMCYRLWSLRSDAWKYVPVKTWQKMTKADRTMYRTNSPFMPGWPKNGGVRCAR